MLRYKVFPHVPVETILIGLPSKVVEGITFILVILFTYDFKESLQEAMDLKELLEKLDDYKAVVQRMEKKMHAIVAFTPIPNIDDLREVPENAKEHFLYRVEKMRKQHISRIQTIIRICGGLYMGLFCKKKNRNKSEFIDIVVENLIEWNEPNGEGCIVSNRVTKDGFKVGYMYREQPLNGRPDSGWRFMAGNEDDEYMNDSNNHHVFAINTICNYDEDIIPYLRSKIGSTYIRVNNTKFEADDGSKPIFIAMQNR